MCKECGHECFEEMSMTDQKREVWDESEDRFPCPTHPDTLFPWGVDCPKCIEADLDIEDMQIDTAFEEELKARWKERMAAQRAERQAATS